MTTLRQKRAAEVRRLRHKCVKCSRRLPEKVGGQPPRCGCGGRGHVSREVGAILGLSTSAVNAYLADPDGTKAKARKQRYGRPCLDCGELTDGSGGREKAPDRCAKCKRAFEGEGLILGIPVGKWSRKRDRTVCGFKTCDEAPKPGSLMCAEHTAYFDRLREEDELRQKRLSRRALRHPLPGSPEFEAPHVAAA